MPNYKGLKYLEKGLRQRIIGNLLTLRGQLESDIPQKTATDTLLLATWNIREFGDNRTAESLYYIAEIISRFDIIAVQEVSSNMAGIKKLLKLLDNNWGLFLTDSTDGSAGGSERLAYLYDKSKIRFEDLAGNLVLAPDNLVLEEVQFARAPYRIAFNANWFRFDLVTVHIYYGTSSPNDKRRVAEIGTIAKLLTKKAKKEDANFILLGDFNIFNTDDLTMKALEDNGFFVPDAIKQHPTDLGGTRHYDQMAFNLKIDDKMAVFDTDNQKSGAFDFTKSVYRRQDVEIYKPCFPKKQVEGKTDEEIEKYYLSTWRTFQMSDHLPLWIQLKIDFSNQYLERIKSS
jgi:endonuclease/exonuclease/phosphatase family metal-dependent hydrolase